MTHNHTLCFVAGRSGGHILPALTIAEQYKVKNPTAYIVFFTTHTALDTALVHEHPVVTHHIPLHLENIPRAVWKLPLYGLHVLKTFIQSIYHLRKHRPSRVISTGGYIAIPVIFAARLLRIECELYTLDAVPGKAAKFIAPYVQTNTICFAQAAQHLLPSNSRLVAYPVRFATNTVPDTAPLYEQLHFSPNKRTLLIFGGSQGSISLNTLIRDWLVHDKDLCTKIQIIHQTGSSDATDWQGFYKDLAIPAHVFAYDNSMNRYYAIADLVIARAGAGTLFELAFFSKKSVIIPLETTTTNHQVDNAYAMAEMHPQLFDVITQNQIQYSPIAAYSRLRQHLFASKN